MLIFVTIYKVCLVKQPLFNGCVNTCMVNDYFIKVLVLITQNKLLKSMFLSNICLFLCPCFTTKTTKLMTKSYYYQVNPVLNSCLYWCVAFMFYAFGNLAIFFNDNSFLHIINPFIN